jgi:hypothetical protein
MPPDHIKRYGSVQTTTVDLNILANCGPSTLWPTSRIGLVMKEAAGVWLTVQQSRELREKLEAAERDVIAGCPSLDNAEKA